MNPKDLPHSYTPPPDGQGVSLSTSPTQGTILYVSPGGWAVLELIGKKVVSTIKWALGLGGWILYWIERGP
jgi:hypothetical protein